MIIDTHVHIGDMIGFHMTEEDVLYSMQQYGIDHSIVSCLDAAEFDHELRLIPSKYCRSQIECLQKVVDFAKKYPDRISAAAWLRPYNEKADYDLYKTINDNRKYIKAIKFHPFHSNVPFDSVAMEPFIELAQHYGLPVVVHTGGSDAASCVWCIWDSAPITKKLLNWSPDSRISMVIRPGYLCKAPCCSFRPQELKRSCSAVTTPLTALTPICITVMVTVLFIRIIFMYCPVCFLPKITTASCTRMPPTSSEFLFTKPSFAAYFFSRTKIFKTDSLTTDYRSFLWQTARQKEPHRNAARKRQP